MSKITTIKCDRCGAIPEGDEAQAAMSTVRITTSKAVWVADLCGACTDQIRGTVDFEMKKRTGTPKGVKAGAPIKARVGEPIPA